MEVLSAILLSDTGNSPPETLEQDESWILPLLDHFRDCIAPRLGDSRVPELTIQRFGETLRKASRLYRYDGKCHGGTTAEVVEDGMERTRYWAFDLLISLAAKSRKRLGGKEEGDEGSKERRVARGVTEALMKRFEEALRGFLDDSSLRGQTPFNR